MSGSSLKKKVEGGGVGRGGAEKKEMMSTIVRACSCAGWCPVIKHDAAHCYHPTHENYKDKGKEKEKTEKKEEVETKKETKEEVKVVQPVKEDVKTSTATPLLLFHHLKHKYWM
jgi:hypothetical protein